MLADLDRALLVVADIQAQIDKKRKRLLQSSKFKAKMANYDTELATIARNAKFTKDNLKLEIEATTASSMKSIEAIKLTAATPISKIVEETRFALKGDLDAIKRAANTPVQLRIAFKRYGEQLKDVRGWLAEADEMEAEGEEGSGSAKAPDPKPKLKKIVIKKGSTELGTAVAGDYDRATKVLTVPVVLWKKGSGDPLSLLQQKLSVTARLREGRRRQVRQRHEARQARRRHEEGHLQGLSAPAGARPGHVPCHARSGVAVRRPRKEALSWRALIPGRPACGGGSSGCWRRSASVVKRSAPPRRAPDGTVTTTTIISPSPQASEAMRQINETMAHAASAIESSSAASQALTKTGDAIEDGVITTKIKAALLTDPDVKSLHIDVGTHNGQVTLSGTVDTAASVERALHIARDTKGVTSVDNQLVVKTST